MLCIKNGRIHDLVKEEPYVADILVKDGKIAAIGEHLEADGAEVMDASGRDVACRIGAIEVAVGVVGEQHCMGLAAVIQHDALRVLRKQGDQGLHFFLFAGGP